MNRYNKMPHEIMDATISVPKILILFNVVATLMYISWWLNFGNAGVLWLFIPLFIGEIYHAFQALGYAATIWNQAKRRKPEMTDFPAVDVYITVCGEPTDLVKNTIRAALDMEYPNFKVFVLNDGKSRRAPNWEEINFEAEKMGAVAIIREMNDGAKAGNINNALRLTSAPLISVFDADHMPYKSFLSQTVPYFSDEKMAIVQTPQYYRNRDSGYLTAAAWEQQELFFGPICRGKNSLNAIFWCGTNAVIRRQALEEIGGVPEDNIAEDFLASLFIHNNGWNSAYVPEILSEGLAPHNLQDYVTQQFRWARGSSELMFKHNPIFGRNLTFWQKVQYLHSSSHYLNGFIFLIDISVPIIVLLAGLAPATATTSNFMIYFLPFMFSVVYLLMTSTHNTITFRSIQLSMSTSFVYAQAVFSAIFEIKSPFRTTAKEAETGNYLRLAVPHIAYVFIGLFSIFYSVLNFGLTPSVVTNGAWVIFNIIMLWAFIRVAYPWGQITTPSRTPTLTATVTETPSTTPTPTLTSTDTATPSST